MFINLFVTLSVGAKYILFVKYAIMIFIFLFVPRFFRIPYAEDCLIFVRFLLKAVVCGMASRRKILFTWFSRLAE